MHRGSTADGFDDAAAAAASAHAGLDPKSDKSLGRGSKDFAAAMQHAIDDPSGFASNPGGSGMSMPSEKGRLSYGGIRGSSGPAPTVRGLTGIWHRRGRSLTIAGGTFLTVYISGLLAIIWWRRLVIGQGRLSVA